MIWWGCRRWCQWSWYGRWWAAPCHVITRSGGWRLLWQSRERAEIQHTQASTSYISSLRKLSLASHRGSHTGHWPPGSHHRQQAPVDRKRGKWRWGAHGDFRCQNMSGLWNNISLSGTLLFGSLVNIIGTSALIEYDISEGPFVLPDVHIDYKGT